MKINHKSDALYRDQCGFFDHLSCHQGSDYNESMSIHRLMIIGAISLLPSLALCWQLVIIQTISQTGKTFVTRTGKVNGFTEGIEGSFTTKNSAVNARAIKVTRDYTVWRLLDVDAVTPFRKGQTVTFNYSTEAIWLEVPNGERIAQAKKKKIMQRKEEESFLPKYKDPNVEVKPDGESQYVYDKEKEDFAQQTVHKSAIVAKGLLGLGLSESVSGVSAETSGSRSQLQGELIYQMRLYPGFFLDLGVRRDSETSTLSNATLTSERFFFTLGSTFYFPPVNFISRTNPYVGITFGLGESSTTVAGSTQTGSSTLLPNVRLGLEYQMSETFKFQLEGGFDSMISDETLNDGSVQKTSQTNGKIGVGLRILL